MTSALPLRTLVLEWMRGTKRLDKSQTRLTRLPKTAVADSFVLVEDHPDSLFPSGG